MLKSKKVYRVFNNNELWSKKQVDFLHGIMCTDNFDCRNMSMKDSFSKSKCISGSIVDESIKDCLIFTYFDRVNYPVEENTFVEISYEDLLGYCEEVEMIVNIGE